MRWVFSEAVSQKSVRDRSGLALETVKNVIRHCQSEWRDEGGEFANGESVSSDLLDDTDDRILFLLPCLRLLVN